MTGTIETFRDAELHDNIVYNDHYIQSSLSDWYHEIRNKKFSELMIGDLCRSVRQKIFIAYLLPYILIELKKDTLAGDIYDGELIVALNHLHIDFWQRHTVEKDVIRQMVEDTLNVMNDDLKQDSIQFIQKLS